MPLEVDLFEAEGSGSFTAASESVSKEMNWIVHGNFLDYALSDEFGLHVEDVVYNWAAHNLPLYITIVTDEEDYIITLADINIEDAGSDKNTFRITGTYEPPDSDSSDPSAGPANGEELSDYFTQISFNTTPEQIHINKGIAVVEVQKAEEITSPSLSLEEIQCIGLTDEGITGADIYERAFKFQITAYVPSTFLTYKYVSAIYHLTATVNEKHFFGFPPGSVLFMGLSGSGSTKPGLVPITFEFEAKANYKFSKTLPTGLPPEPDPEDPVIPVDPEAPDPQVLTIKDEHFPDSAETFEGSVGHSGWSLVDYRYQNVVDEGQKWVIAKPTHRVIHQVYMTSQFKRLGLTIEPEEEP